MEKLITKDMVFNITDGVKARKEYFGLLVVSKTTPAMSLNDDAMAVWELCNGVNTVDDIFKAINEVYQDDGIDESVIKALESFLKLGLIKQFS